MLHQYSSINISYIGLNGTTDKQLTDSLVASVRKLNKKLGIAQSYKENGVSEQTFNDKADLIAENAVKDPCTLSNPREIDKENMKKVLECSYYGTDVTF